MKKLSPLQKLRLAKHQARCFERTLHHRYKRKLKNSANYEIRNAEMYIGENKVRKIKIMSEGIPMPSLFCLDDNFAEVAAFLSKMRTDFSSKKKLKYAKKKMFPSKVQSWFDISSIDRITPSAALILAAEFDRRRRIIKRKIYAIDVAKWKPEVSTLFSQLGLFSILEIDAHLGITTSEDGDVTILPLRSGDAVEGEEADRLIKDLSQIALEAANFPTEDENSNNDLWLEKALEIYLILIEAMDNAVSYAYPNNVSFSMPHVGRWWMTAAVDRRHGKLTVAIYDQGVSIPVSLPRWRHHDRVKRFWQRIFGNHYDIRDSSKDGQAIAVAMKVAVSSTGMQHRGKGLPLMKKFIDECRDGRLRIVSRCGEYIYKKGKRPSTQNHKDSIGGTLVEWEVFL